MPTLADVTPRPARGSEVPTSKLTEKKVLEILRLAAEGGKIRAMARAYGVSPAAIRNVVLRRTWKHVEVKPAGKR